MSSKRRSSMNIIQSRPLTTIMEDIMEDRESNRVSQFFIVSSNFDWI
jgi:hypothetical protein